MYQFHLEMSVSGPLEEVFAAWHLPEQLQKWFCPGDMVIGQVMSNFSENGVYKIKMQEMNGNSHWLEGEYQTIELNKRLVFTWHWMDEPTSSVVEVDFSERNATTCNVKLLHKGFNDQDDCDLHQQAWIACLEKLSTIALS